MENQSNESNAPSLEDELKQYDKMLNILAHQDWCELYLFLGERAHGFQQEMDHAPSWEQFIVARGLRRYTSDYLMKLPEIIKAAKEDVEKRIVTRDLKLPDDELPEYEQE